MTEPWPITTITNPFGIATLSLGGRQHHDLPDELRAASQADPESLWEPTTANLRVAEQLGDLMKTLGMQIACTQPLRKIEGVCNPNERRATLDLVTKRFPFMRTFDTDLVFMCSNIRTDSGVTSDLQTVSWDLAELGDMAAGC